MGLIGPNGAGKSTLLKAAVGVVHHGARSGSETVCLGLASTLPGCPNVPACPRR